MTTSALASASNWIGALFPEIQAAPWNSRVRFLTLSNIGVKTSIQAKRKGYIQIREARYPSPGLWIAEGDLSKLELIAGEINAARIEKTRKEDERRRKAAQNKKERERRRDDILQHPITRQFLSRLFPELKQSDLRKKIRFLTLRETGSRTAANAVKKGFIPFPGSQSGSWSEMIVWASPDMIPELEVMAAEIIEGRAENARKKEAAEQAELAENLHFENWRTAVVLPTGIMVRGRTLVKRVTVSIDVGGDRWIKYETEVSLAITLRDAWRDPSPTLKALEKKASAHVGKFETAVTELRHSAPELPAEIVGELLVEAFRHAQGKRGDLIHRLKASFQGRLAEKKRHYAEHRKSVAVLSVTEILGNYALVFTSARGIKRRISFFSGPTNSGKTYRAVEALTAAVTGTYLAPLRLLALEVRDALLERGVPTDLITGEEQERIVGASHVSSTIEMLDFERETDVTVIDEADLLADPHRGPAWVAALCGAPSAHLIVVGSAAAEPLVRTLAERLGDSYESVCFERMSPLTVADKPCDLARLEKGDCLVAFSRRDVLDYKAYFEEQGRRVSVVYGSLPPEVRREQARRFRDGETDILVATDAIGMGLNLPLQRIVFSSVEKFDGRQVVPLSGHLAKQIAGRAGRFGLSEKGVVTALNRYDLDAVRAWVTLPDSPLQPPVEAAPKWKHVAALAAALKTDKLADILKSFARHYKFDDPLFRPASLSQIIRLAELSDRFGKLPLADRFILAHAPVDEDDNSLTRFRGWIKALQDGHAVASPVPVSLTDLARLEDQARACTLYGWLAYRFENFGECHQARSELKRVSGLINERLRLRSVRRQCSVCGKFLPPAFRFGLCEGCYQGRKYQNYWDLDLEA